MNKKLIHLNTIKTEVVNIASSIKKAGWRRLAVAALLFWLPITIFVQLADEVLEHEPIGFDVPVLRFAESLASPAIDPYVVAVTELGGAPMSVAVLIIGLAYFTRRNRYRAAAFLTAAIGGAAAITYVFKLVFARDRPDLWQAIIEESTYSFPSGHAMASSAVAFSLMILFWRTRWRWVAVGLGTFYFLTISATRVYLGVHYPSDVIAGWCISLAWVLLVMWMLSGETIWRGGERSIKWLMKRRIRNDANAQS